MYTLAQRKCINKKRAHTQYNTNKLQNNSMILLNTYKTKNNNDKPREQNTNPWRKRKLFMLY